MRAAFAVILVVVSLPAQGQEKLDLYGDPLAAGADVRLGTIRFRHVNLTWAHMHSHEISFSDNGTVVSQYGGALRFWNAESGELQRELDLGESGVAYARFSPDRTMIVTMCHEPSATNRYLYRTRIWDVATGKLLTTLSDDAGFSDARFTADGNTLMTVARGTIKVWDVSRGEQLLTFTVNQNETIQLDISQRNDQLVAITTSEKVYLWDWLAGQEPELLTQGQQRFRSSVVFSPTQSVLAITVNKEESIEIWDTAELKMIREIRSSEERLLDLHALTFTPDGQSLVCSRTSDPLTERSQILVWDTASWNLKHTLQVGTLRPDELAVSPDSNRLAVRGGFFGGCIAVFDLKSGKRLPEKPVGHEGPVTSVVFSRDSKVVVTAAEDATVRVWDSETGQRLQQLPHQPSRADTATISPDGRRIASLNGRNILHIWDAKTGKELHRLPGHGKLGRAIGLAFTPDSRQLLSYGDDLYLRMWDVDSGKLLTELEARPQGFERPTNIQVAGARGGGRNRLDGALFSVNAERLLLTAGNTIHCFNTGTAQQIGKFSGDFYRKPLAISPDGTQLLTVGYQRPEKTEPPGDNDRGKHLVRILELPSGRENWRDTVPGKCQSGPAAFSPDGRLMAVAFREPQNEIRIWDVEDRKQLLVIEDVSNMTYFPHTLAFSADNRMVACAQADHSLLIWNLLEEGLPESMIVKPQQQDDTERGSP